MESVEINGTKFDISCSFTKNRNASARLKGNTIVMGIPSRWSNHEKERVGANLLRRAIRAIEKGKWKPDGNKRIRFFHGQRVKALGKEFEIVFVDGKRFGGKTEEGRIEIRVADHQHPEKHEKISKIVRREIVKNVMPHLKERIEKINKSHFNSSIPKISVRDTLARWGSCSPDGSISLSFKLLFMPDSILDYVIVHELAHTKYKSHGKRFWTLVERVVPDYREKRKWLREKGTSVLSQKEVIPQLP